jgi:hypothetical protein
MSLPRTDGNSSGLSSRGGSASSRFAGGTGLALLDDGSVAITAGGLTFYLDDDELWAQTDRDGRTWVGHWVEGEFEIVRSVPAPDASLN